MRPKAKSWKCGVTGRRLGLAVVVLALAVTIMVRRRGAGRGKAYKGLPMEGFVASWYARLRGSQSQLQQYRKQALELTDGLPDGAQVLEVAPGPGYLAVEIARLGRCRVTAMDVSRTFVEITAQNASRAQVTVDVRQGDAGRMPFDDESFDLIVCQAAFKNFAHPLDALNEMHRVLRIGGQAVIQDMNREARPSDIDAEVQAAGVSGMNALWMKWALTGLRRRAYSPTQFESLAAASAFAGCEITTEGIGLEVRLSRPADPRT